MDNDIQKGRLKRWNSDKGFGFIGSEDGRRDIFIHISALKKVGRRPVVGDVIFYQVHTDNDGKKRAVNAQIEGVTEVKPSPARRNVKKQKKINWIPKIFSLALVMLIAPIAYKKLTESNVLRVKSTSSVSSYTSEEENMYICAGKVYCSEMTSCDEAKFYQRNCPGTKMDGDGDGIPCESQWCSW